MGGKILNKEHPPLASFRARELTQARTPADFFRMHLEKRRCADKINRVHSPTPRATLLPTRPSHPRTLPTNPRSHRTSSRVGIAHRP